MRPSISLPVFLVCLLAGLPAPLPALDLQLRFDDCSTDTITQQNGEEYASGRELSIVSLGSTVIELTLASVPGQIVPVNVADVREICFAVSSPSFEQGYEAYQAKEYAVAVEHLQRAASDQNPGNVWAFQWGGYYLGLCYYEMGEYALAEQAFAALRQRAPDTIFLPDIRKLELEILAAQGKIAEALTLLDVILAGDDVAPRERVELYFLKCDLHLARQEWREAERAVDKGDQAGGKLDAAEAKKIRMRADLKRAEVALARGSESDLASAERKATAVLRGTRYENEDEREARAFAYVVLGEVIIKRTDAVRSEPAKVRAMLTQALELFLRVVAIYGGDESISRSIRAKAFSRTIEQATTLGLSDVRGATKYKASVYGF